MPIKIINDVNNQFDDDLPPILSLTDDIVFKIFFTKKPKLFERFLGAVIQPKDEKFFEEIRITNPEVFPDHDGGKHGILDIKVTVLSGKIIDVEMQNKKVAHYRERIVSYLSGMIRNQIGSGEDYGKIRKVISITISGERLIDDDAYHHRYTLYDPNTHSEFTDLVEVHIIELPKLPQDDDGSDLWKWTKLISVKKEEELKMVATMSPVMNEAAAYLREVSEDKKTREMMQSIRIRQWDDYYREEERVKDIARKLIAMGDDTDKIVAVTGLDLNDVLKLKGE